MRAKETGILVHMPPFAQVTELPDGGAQMYVRDPGGNLIELDTPDASVLDRSVVEMRRLVDAIRSPRTTCARPSSSSRGRRPDGSCRRADVSGKAAQVAADRLRDLIRSGDLGPGDRLPVERVLAVQLGVSRSTLREGIRSLRSTGLLHARQGSGTYVTDLDPATLASPLVFALARSGGQIPRVFEVRAMLEVGGAELAAEHATAARRRGPAAPQRPHRPHRRAGGDAGGGLEVPPPHPPDVAQRAARAAARLHRRARQGRPPARASRATRSASAAPSSTSRSSRRSHRGEPAAAGAAMRRRLDYVRRVLQALEEERGPAASGGDEPNGEAPGLA